MPRLHPALSFRYFGHNVSEYHISKNLFYIYIKIGAYTAEFASTFTVHILPPLFSRLLQKKSYSMVHWHLCKASPSFLQFGARKVAVWCIYAFAKVGKSFPIFFTIRCQKSCSVMHLCLYKEGEELPRFSCNLEWKKLWCDASTLLQGGGRAFPSFCNHVQKKLQCDASTPLQRGGRASNSFLQFGAKKSCGLMHLRLCKEEEELPHLFCNYF